MAWSRCCFTCSFLRDALSIAFQCQVLSIEALLSSFGWGSLWLGHDAALHGSVCELLCPLLATVKFSQYISSLLNSFGRGSIWLGHDAASHCSFYELFCPLLASVSSLNCFAALHCSCCELRCPLFASGSSLRDFIAPYRSFCHLLSHCFPVTVLSIDLSFT